ncbi:hypothetical protein C8R47DRAFT_1081363 [Mycena vitilis]|nr:hypothetical protein C8R47DRAFT_1081363 [Mycena vitilis]
MGGGPKSPKKSPHRKAPAASRKSIKSKSMIDDEAEESNASGDGVLVDPTGNTDDLGQYGSDQDLDQDPFDAQSDDSESSLPASLFPAPRTPPNKSRLTKLVVLLVLGHIILILNFIRKKPDPVIDISSSSEEDLTAMDVDDRKPAGVKPSTLPPSLVTRSATAKRAASSQTSNATTSPKKPKTARASVIEADMMQFMTTFMNSYLAAQAPPAEPQAHDPPASNRAHRESSLPRVDFDALELQRGSTRGAGPSRNRELSPAWDPPYDDADPDPLPSSKAKGEATAKRVNEDVDVDEPVAKGKGKGKAMISRVSGYTLFPWFFAFYQYVNAHLKHTHEL